MAPFQYRYSFSVDDEIIERCGSLCSSWFGDTILETRVKFIVKARSGEKEMIGSESYAVGALPKKGCESFLEYNIGMRLKDYWMSDREIRTMIRQLLIFAEENIYPTGGRRRGKIPLALDLEVRTVQREGEDMVATRERAMEPAYLPPLYFYDVFGAPWPSVRLHTTIIHMTYFREGMRAATIRVEDVEKAGAVMELCCICGCQPRIGTQISSLPCAHAYHYHCIVPLLIENGDCCPICHHPSEFEQGCKHNRRDCDDDDVDDVDDLEAFVRQEEALKALVDEYGSTFSGVLPPAGPDSHL